MFKFNEKLRELRGPAGGDENGKPLKKYVPIEEVVEEIPEPMDSKNEEPENNEEAEQDPYEAFVEDLKNEEKNEEIMNQEIGFVEKEGVAHIGPDVLESEQGRADGTGEFYEHPAEEKFKFQKKGMKPLINLMNGIPVTTRQVELNKAKIIEMPDDRKKIKTSPFPKDNLKTIKKTKDKTGETSKLQRMLRKTIGKFYDNQKEDDRSSWEDVLEDQKN